LRLVVLSNELGFETQDNLRDAVNDVRLSFELKRLGSNYIEAFEIETDTDSSDMTAVLHVDIRQGSNLNMRSCFMPKPTGQNFRAPLN
jgi:hypothetical protein